MSRGGRGGGRGGRGGGWGGRGGPGSELLALGLTPADLAAISKEQAALYPARDSVPTLAATTSADDEIARLQVEYRERIRRSAYYIVEVQKSTELPRYSDKYRTEANRPRLRKDDLNPAFFPPEVFDAYFNPKKRKRKSLAAAAASKKKKGLNLDELKDGDDDADGSDADKGSDAGSQEGELEDYDEDSDDNDYAENYFDNGEGDDVDDAGGGDDGDATYD
ncbi:hypothetical protein EXIGLDRAFT_740282 [Exidia glandulosa HHB12029]|uniref:DNA-directed RNA polymerase III subunit n=1 Tax=Exidia glandulosa HHB12029 TaxID=1314781 RepID=A0A165HYZ0_EXIGL|nr:hypothetical protein EXIGLDRAFT_740282 [Exidia glandulosa HHB12029]